MAIALFACATCATLTAAQNAPEAATEETVANLAAGRVVIAVVKNAILIGTVENPIEAETRLPIPVALGSTRVGVILGAVQWYSPSTQKEIARLDQELPHLRTSLIAAVAAAPHLEQPTGGGEAADLEVIGQGLLDRLDQVVQSLHGKLDLPPNEPILQLVVADYLSGYGPEVWLLSYGVKQEELQIGYWTTRALRPSYLQLWPPEKGHPRTLMEFAYPPEKASPILLELLRGKDPRLEKITSDPAMKQVANIFLQGDSGKITATDATQFMRAALDATAPPKARESVAIIGQESGFAWILPPPPEPVQPNQRAPQSARPPGAPTLVK